MRCPLSFPSFVEASGHATRSCARVSDGFFGTRGRAVKHEFLHPPEQGRRFVTLRRVRLGDVNRANRLRLGAVRPLPPGRRVGRRRRRRREQGRRAWVLRRALRSRSVALRATGRVEVTTFCSGTGSRWAERRTTLAVDGSSVAEAVAIWVYVDRAGRPAPLGDWFFDHYGDAAAGRKVSAGSRSHTRPPMRTCAHGPSAPAISTCSGTSTTLRTGSRSEDELARLAPARVPVSAELEHRAAIEPGDPVELRVDGRRRRADGKAHRSR